MPSPDVLTARDLMVPFKVTLSPNDSVYEAIKAFAKHHISGAVVLDQGQLVGFVSEKDCLKLLSSRTFHDTPSAHVSDYMTREVTTISPGTDIYSIASIFLRNEFRRLPVVEEGRLLGQVSRRNLLVGMDEMHKQEEKRTRYPDYREPKF